jgi:hypothetical protein
MLAAKPLLDDAASFLDVFFLLCMKSVEDDVLVEMGIGFSKDVVEEVDCGAKATTTSCEGKAVASNRERRGSLHITVVAKEEDVRQFSRDKIMDFLAEKCDHASKVLRSTSKW